MLIRTEGQAKSSQGQLIGGEKICRTYKNKNCKNQKIKNFQDNKQGLIEEAVGVDGTILSEVIIPRQWGFIM